MNLLHFMFIHLSKNMVTNRHPYIKTVLKPVKESNDGLSKYRIRWCGYIHVVLLASCVHTCAEFNITFNRTVARSVQTGKQLHVYGHCWSRSPGIFLHVLLRKGLSLVISLLPLHFRYLVVMVQKTDDLVLAVVMAMWK